MCVNYAKIETNVDMITELLDRNHQRNLLNITVNTPTYKTLVTHHAGDVSLTLTVSRHLVTSQVTNGAEGVTHASCKKYYNSSDTICPSLEISHEVMFEKALICIQFYGVEYNENHKRKDF